MRRFRAAVGAYMMDWAWSRRDLDIKNTEYDVGKLETEVRNNHLSFGVSI